MLAQFRRFAKSPWATGLFVLLMGSFVVFGVRSYLSTGVVSDAVIKAGGRKVTADQFRAMFDRYLHGLAQQNGGQAPTIAQAAAQGMDTRALDEVAYEEAAAALITKLGVRPADRLVADEIGKAPQLHDPVTGRFDERAYKQFLQQNNLTAQQMEGSLRDSIAQRHLLTGMVAGLEAPYAYTAILATFNGEQVNFDYLALTPNMVPPPAKPTDAELTAFMNQNAAAFLRPEIRTVSLVRFSAAQLAPTITVAPADIQKRFDFEKDSLSTPEKRSLVEIPLKSASQGAAVAADLQKGQDPAAVAKSVGAQPVVLTAVPQTAIPDRAVADAAFAMKPGEVRVVSGGLAPAVVKLTGVAAGKTMTLDEARPKIEDEAKRAAAADKARTLANTYDDARNGGADLVQAAAKAGVPVTVLPPFTAQGMDAQNQHVPAPEKLVQTAYRLPQGGMSDILQAAPGEYYAIRVDKVSPAAARTLDEVRAPLTQRLQIETLAKALEAKAKVVIARAKAVGLDAAAHEVGATVQHAVGVARAQPPQQPGAPPPAGFGPQLLGTVFAAKPGDLVSAPEKLSIVVAKVLPLSPPATPALVQASVAARQNATLGLYQDLLAHVREAARVEIKPVVDTKQARAALGLDASAGTGGAAPSPAS